MNPISVHQNFPLHYDGYERGHGFSDFSRVIDAFCASLHTMSSMTPVRIRGKRTATTDEKWHHGKKRKWPLSRAPSERASSVLSGSSEATSTKPRRRKRIDPLLSRLEQLPTEILQTIFELSCNPDLPFASPRLASQLNSPHLYRELTSRILPRTAERGQMFSKTELANVERLLNSRFCTWQIFEEWLISELNERETLQAQREELKRLNVDMKYWAQWAWRGICLHGNLATLSPPKKLLRGPFTEDKVQFLRLVTSTADWSPGQIITPLHHELAREGLKHAVAEGAALDTLRCFWNLGLQPDMDLIRLAVMDAGCKKEIVKELVGKAWDSKSASSDVDLLDPALWTWADRARARGDEKGTWLMALLKDPEFWWV